VLYDPQSGYYTSQQAQIGPKGDFFTSSHLGPDFAELLAEQLLEMWQHMGCPPAFSLVEMGVIFGAAVGFSMASAYLPARQAAGLEPREVLYQRPGLIGPTSGRNRKNIHRGLALLGLAGLLTGLPAWKACHISIAVPMLASGT